MFIKKSTLQYLRDMVFELNSRTHDLKGRVEKLERQQFKPIPGATYKIPTGKTVSKTSNIRMATAMLLANDTSAQQLLNKELRKK
jgi:hypothetical protein